MNRKTSAAYKIASLAGGGHAYTAKASCVQKNLISKPSMLCTKPLRTTKLRAGE